MPTSILHPRNAIHVRKVVAIGLTAILILTSLVLIASAILTIVLPTIKDKDAIQADTIPVVQNLIIPISIPTPLTTNIQPIPSAIRSPATLAPNGQSVLLAPVPTPPG